MFIATLLTNPETPKLDRVAVESLRNAWGGGGYGLMVRVWGLGFRV